MKYILLGLSFLFFIVIAAKIFAFDTAENIKGRNNRAYKLEKVLDYVAVHDGDIFLHEVASKELKMPSMQIYKILFQLEKQGKIRATPKDLLRKPILISLDDYQHYYHRVYVVE